VTSSEFGGVDEDSTSLQQLISSSNHYPGARIGDFSRLATAVQRQRLTLGVSDQSQITRSTALWSLMQLDRGIKNALEDSGVSQAELGRVLSLRNPPEPIDVDEADLHKDFARALRTYLAGLGGQRPIELPDLAAAILRAVRAESSGLLRERLIDLGADIDAAITALGRLVESGAAPEGVNSSPKPLTEAERLARAAQRFGGGTHAVLERAWELAEEAHQTRVHVPYLFQALYERDTRSKDAMTRAADPPDHFLATIRDRSLRDETSTSSEPITGLPPLSAHVSDGLLAAATIADDPSESIDPVDLMLGMLRITACSTVQALEHDGITEARIRAALSGDSTATVGHATEAAATTSSRDYIAGYANDMVAGDDLLGITNEVEAMATLLASRALEPPLALGLFGDWGTGKTFFMTKLQDRIRSKAKFERVKPESKTRTSYRTSIVQINFNAWHYIDKELWASLANAIFEGLDEAVKIQDIPVAGIEPRTQKRLRLLAELDANRRGLEEAHAAQADAQAAVDTASARLVALESADDELAKSVGVGEIVAGVYRVATAVPEIGARADAIIKKVDNGITTAANDLKVDATDLRSDLAAGTRGRLRVGWTSVLHRRTTLLFAIIAGAALIAVGLGLWVSGQPWFGLLVGVATSVAAAAATAWLVAAPAVRILVAARRETRQLIEEKRKDAKKVVDERRSDVQRVVSEVRTVVSERTARNAQLERQLEETEPGREMAQFIKMRRASNAYTSRLGVVAQARDDFEQLTAYLTAENADGPVFDLKGDRLLPPVDRIILYIDDLDRCTERQVVDVLQAVHLLLAFKLFVVVVAVDPRWLLHSLQVESRALDEHQNDERAERARAIDDSDAGAEWQATPMDYLEKIFQIPFALWPMDPEGFGRIITDLSKDRTDGPVAAGTDVHRLAGADAAQTTPVSVETQKQALAVPGGDPEIAAVEEPRLVTSPTVASEVDPEVLQISDRERDFMKLMHPLIATPRSAKRFVNVYRLLKASKAREGAIDFENDRAHRPVLLLLALTTGYPDLAPPILERLHQNTAPKRSIKDVVISAKVGDLAERQDDRHFAEEWGELEARLDEVLDLIAKADAKRTPRPPALNGGLLGDWALPAARFSFEASRVLLQHRATANATNGTGSGVASPPRATRSARPRKSRTST
jgi:cell division septum initiation protein DivIVA